MSRGTGRWRLSRAGWLRVVEVPAEFVPLIWGVWGPTGAQNFSPQGIDVDETSGIDWLVIALHIHAARRE